VKKLALLSLLALVSCTTADASMPVPDEEVTIEEASDGTGVTARLAAAPLANVTHVLPPAAGSLMTACRYTSAGYVCPTADALLLAAGWGVAKPDAIVLFPVSLAMGEGLDVIRAKVSCPTGAVTKMTLKVNDPDMGWEYTIGPATAACSGATEDLDLDVSTYLLTGRPDGFRMYTVSLTSSKAGAYFRGVELATH
jgi:hypothetical protein